MQIQERAGVTGLADAIKKAQDYLLSIQKPDGHWVAELESNVTITAEILLLHKVWGISEKLPLAKIETYLRSKQRDHGGWELFYGDGGEVSTSVEAYMALRLLGVPAKDPALLKAKEFILGQGGISKTRIFTKLHLALIGCYDWRGDSLHSRLDYVLEAAIAGVNLRNVELGAQQYGAAADRIRQKAGLFHQTQHSAG